MKWFPDMARSLEDFQEGHPSGSLTLLIATSQRAVDFSVRVTPKGASGSRSLQVYLHDILLPFQASKEIELHWASGSMLWSFAQPSAAVKFSLVLQEHLRSLAQETGLVVFDRFAVHGQSMATPAAKGSEESDARLSELFDVCSRLAQTAKPNQLLLTAACYERSRLALSKNDFNQMNPLVWIFHGHLRIPESEELIELFEVGESDQSALSPPDQSLDFELVSHATEISEIPGWRPGPCSVVPGSRCCLERRLPDWKFGEVWMGQDTLTKEPQRFEFCFRQDWCEKLREHAPVLQQLKQRVSQERNVLGIKAISLTDPPFYLMTEHFEGVPLGTWCHQRGGIGSIPINSRLELIGQAARGLAAAHNAKLLHKGLSPDSILVDGNGETPKNVQVKLTGFGLPRDQSAQNSVAATPDTGEMAGRSAALAGESCAAPEILAGGAHSTKSDTYSLGVLFGQLVQGDFAQSLTPDRIKEILSVFKREELLAFFAEAPGDRKEGASHLAREIYSLLKQRETVEGSYAGAKQRRFAGAAALAAVVVVMIAAINKFMPASEKGVLPSARQEAQKNVITSGNPGSPGAGSGDSNVRVKSEEEKGKRQGSVSSNPNSTEDADEEWNPVKVLVNFLILPVLAVIALGGLLQWVLPKLWRKAKGYRAVKSGY